MTGALDKELNAYIERLNTVQKKSLLGFIKSIFPGKEEGEPYTIEDYNNELQEAEAEIERGEFYTNEEVFAISKKIIDARKNNKVV